MMTNQTATKFGYPNNLIVETSHWSILLRPTQVTLGSLILVCSEETKSIGKMSSAASTDFHRACNILESTLTNAFAPDKFNYLALMMVDPHVHFHVIPRYKSEVEFNDRMFNDMLWPKPPILAETIKLNDLEMKKLLATLKMKLSK